MKRITTLLGVLAALMLIPVAQALAAPAVLTVEAEGAGSGKAVPNYPGAYYYGEPEEINCEWNGGTEEKTGVCEAEMMEGPLAEREGVWMKPEAAKGSEFVEWYVEEGEFESCNQAGSGNVCFINYNPAESGGPTAKVTARFCLEGQSREECGIPLAYKLSVSKTGTGKGVVTSSSSGVVHAKSSASPIKKCGSGGTCFAEFEDETEVTLTAEVGAESEFTGWTGCDSEPEGKCLVTMSEAKEVEANFDEEATVEEFPLALRPTVAPAGRPSGRGCGTRA